MGEHPVTITSREMFPPQCQGPRNGRALMKIWQERMTLRSYRRSRKRVRRVAWSPRSEGRLDVSE